MTRRTGTGLMEASGPGTITGHKVNLTMLVDQRIILVLTIWGQDCGMTLILHCVPKDQSVSMTHLKVKQTFPNHLNQNNT